MNSKERITILLACTANLPLLFIGESESPYCFKSCPQICNHRKAYAIFIDYLRALDVKMSSQNRKILLSTDQCAPHPQDTNYLENLKVVLFPQTA
jgi:hypothetical protein